MDLAVRPKRKASIVTSEKWTESFTIEPERRESLVHEAKERMTVAAEAQRRKSLVIEAQRKEQLAAEALRRESMASEGLTHGASRKKSVAFVSPTDSLSGDLLDLEPPPAESNDGREVIKCENCGHEQYRSRSYPEESLTRIKEAIAELERYRSESIPSKSNPPFSLIPSPLSLPILAPTYPLSTDADPPRHPLTINTGPIRRASQIPPHATMHGRTPSSPFSSSFSTTPSLSVYSSSLSEPQSRRSSTTTASHSHSRRPSRADVLFEAGRLPGLEDTPEDSGDEHGEKDALGGRKGGRGSVSVSGKNGAERRAEDESGNRIHHKGVWGRMLHWELDASNAESGAAARRRASRGGKYETCA